MGRAGKRSAVPPEFGAQEVRQGPGRLQVPGLAQHLVAAGEGGEIHKTAGGDDPLGVYPTSLDVHPYNEVWLAPERGPTHSAVIC